MKILVIRQIEVVSTGEWSPMFRKTSSSPYPEWLTIYQSTRCYIPEEVTLFTCVRRRFPYKKRDFFRPYPFSTVDVLLLILKQSVFCPQIVAHFGLFFSACINLLAPDLFF